jgi:histidine triad (HIT) family protein
LTDLACVFCDIIARKAPAHIVYEDDDLIAFLDSRPITDGHTLLVTKRHYERLGEIPEATVAKLFTQAQELNETIMNKMSAQGANISVNDGNAAHQLVPHIHVHIIPRKANDGVTFSARRRLSPEQMEHIRTLIGT